MATNANIGILKENAPDIVEIKKSILELLLTHKAKYTWIVKLFVF